MNNMDETTCVVMRGLYQWWYLGNSGLRTLCQHVEPGDKRRNARGIGNRGDWDSLALHTESCAFTPLLYNCIPVGSRRCNSARLGARLHFERLLPAIYFARPYSFQLSIILGKMPQLCLLDVLQQLGTDALDKIFKEPSSRLTQGARLSCRALKQHVDSNLSHARFRISKGLFQQWRPGQVTPLARFCRCTRLTLSVSTDSPDSDGEDDEGPPPLDELPDPWLATLCVAGVGPDVSAGIRHLHLQGPLELGPMAAYAITLAGWLHNVRKLDLEAGYSEGEPPGNLSMYAALRNAMPSLDTLVLHGRSDLPGIEALAGSSLTTLQVTCNYLCMDSARSLVQLTQLRTLSLSLEAHDVGVDEDSAAARADVPGDADDVETTAGLEAKEVRQLWVLRRLLVSAPLGWQRIEVPSVHMFGRDGQQSHAVASMTCVFASSGGDLESVEVASRKAWSFDPESPHIINYLAAIVLPRLAATGQRRLPLVKLARYAGIASDLARHLQPQRPLARLLALCDRVQFGELAILDAATRVTSPRAAAGAVSEGLCAVLRACGWPEVLQLGPSSFLSLEAPVTVRLKDTGTRCGGGSAAGPAAPSALPLPLGPLTPGKVLQLAADLLWHEVAAEEAGVAATSTASSSQQTTAAVHDTGRHMHKPDAYVNIVLLRGKLLKQLSVGVGCMPLQAWLTELLLSEQLQDDAAAAARGYFNRVMVAPATFTAVLECHFGDYVRLAHAAAGSDVLAPGDLEVLPVRGFSKSMQTLWNSNISKVSARRGQGGSSRTFRLRGVGSAHVPLRMHIPGPAQQATLEETRGAPGCDDQA